MAEVAFTLFSAIMGIICLAGSFLNWDFFYEHYYGRLLTKFLSRTGVRMLYGLIGILLLGTSVYLLLT